MRSLLFHFPCNLEQNKQELREMISSLSGCVVKPASAVDRGEPRFNVSGLWLGSLLDERMR